MFPIYLPTYYCEEGRAGVLLVVCYLLLEISTLNRNTTEVHKLNQVESYPVQQQHSR